MLDKITKEPHQCHAALPWRSPESRSGCIIETGTDKEAIPWALHRRAGSMKVKHRPELQKRRGNLGCKFDMRSNILLPNGDVLVCANDYGMKHVLGNLIASDYESLFLGEEFKKLKNGQKDDSLDISVQVL